MIDNVGTGFNDLFQRPIFFEKIGGQIVNKEFNPTLTISTWPDEGLILDKHVEKVKTFISSSFTDYKLISSNSVLVDGQKAQILEYNITNTVNFNTPTESCENCNFKLGKLDLIVADGRGNIYYVAGVAPQAEWTRYRELIANSQRTFRLFSK